MFAIANVAALLYLDPSKIDFNANVMRDHLKNCLRNGQMTPFPYSVSVPLIPPAPINIIVEKIYCLCRRPKKFKVTKAITKDEEMLQCKDCSEYYHRICIPLSCGSILKKKQVHLDLPILF